MHDAKPPVPSLPEDVQAFLKEHGFSENLLEDIIIPFIAMRNNVPHLGEKDIDKIAAKVTDAIEERLQHRYRNAPDKKRWKDQARAAIRDLVIGLLGSGLYSLIVYLSTVVSHMGSENQPRADSRKESAIQSKLLWGVNSEDRKDLEANFYFLFENLWTGIPKEMADADCSLESI